MKVYQALARASERRDKEGWADIMKEMIDNIMKGAPSGASFLPEESNREQIVFAVNYHHMDKNGHHDGWTYHRVIVTHDLLGMNIRVTGRNLKDIRNYLSGVFYQWLMKDVDWIIGRYKN